MARTESALTSMTTRPPEQARRVPSVSIVMTYFERRRQLANTLQSFVLHDYTGLDVIVVDDGSVAEALSEEMFEGLPFPVRLLRAPTDRRHVNPCIAFNRGLALAAGDIVILQNAECLHVCDVLAHARAHLTADEYFTYACYSLGREKTEALMQPDRQWSIGEARALVTARRTASFDGDDAWYNHSVHRPSALHFCAAILRVNLERLRGFDPRYGSGIAFDDDEFLCRIRRDGLRVRIVDEVAVLHQWHYTPARHPDFDTLFARNAMLYRFVTRAEHGAAPGGGTLRYRLFEWALPWLLRVRRLRGLLRSRAAVR